MSDLADRLAHLKHRLRTAYDGIGHSHGRPFVYVVYPPDQERAVRRIIDEELRDEATLTFYQLDLLPLVLQSTAGQEQRREGLLNDPIKGEGAAISILGIWSGAVARAISHRLAEQPPTGRPVIVLRGLAALHPLGTPTTMMEALADKEPRDPATNRVVPIVLLVPGVRPPQTSRVYRFLGQEDLTQTFYRGEEA